MLHLLLAPLLVGLSPPPTAPPPLLNASSPVEVAVQGTVEVTVTDARSDEGEVVALLFSSSEGFPADVRKAAYTASAPIRGGRASLQVADVRAGRYAIVVFHDADGNGSIKRNLLGMPREGIGVTRFDGGRPSYRATAVDVPATGAQFTIPLNYR